MGLWPITSRTSNGMFIAGAAITLAASRPVASETPGGPAIVAGPFSFRPHSHEGLAVTFGDQRPVLLEGFVVKFDDARARARLGFSLADDLCRAMHCVAFEPWVGELHIGHA